MIPWTTEQFHTVMIIAQRNLDRKSPGMVLHINLFSLEFDRVSSQLENGKSVY